MCAKKSLAMFSIDLAFIRGRYSHVFVEKELQRAVGEDVAQGHATSGGGAPMTPQRAGMPMRPRRSARVGRIVADRESSTGI